MDGYLSLDKTLEQSFKSPLFAIDAKHYNTRYHLRYTRLFINELLSRDKDYKGDLYFFEKGQFKEVNRDI